MSYEDYYENTSPFDEPMAAVIAAMVDELRKADVYVDVDDPTEAVIDTTGTRVNLETVAKAVVKAVYLSVANDTKALSDTLYETIQNMPGRPGHTHDDVVRYSGMAAEAHSISHALTIRAKEL